MLERIDTWDPLPPKVHRKSGAFYLVHKNRWHHLGRSAAAAQSRHRELCTQLGVPRVDQDFIASLHERARRRARRLGVPFELTPEDLQAMYSASGGRCALSGVPFDCGNPSGLKRRPWIPSIDRQRPAEGYTRGNSRLICFAMNAALNAWGDSDFERIATGFLRQRGFTVAVS